LENKHFFINVKNKGVFNTQRQRSYWQDMQWTALHGHA